MSAHCCMCFERCWLPENAEPLLTTAITQLSRTLLKNDYEQVNNMPTTLRMKHFVTLTDVAIPFHYRFCFDCAIHSARKPIYNICRLCRTTNDSLPWLIKRKFVAFFNSLEFWFARFHLLESKYKTDFQCLFVQYVNLIKMLLNESKQFFRCWHFLEIRMKLTFSEIK